MYKIKTRIPLPPMTVDKTGRTKSAHGIPAPDNSEKNMRQQIQETMQMNEDAKHDGWRPDTLDLLEKYLRPYIHGVDGDEIVKAVQEVTGFTSWRDLSRFIADDECSEFFNMAHKYYKTKNGGQPEVKRKGFIHGGGFGYLDAYRIATVPVLKKMFDAKYFFNRRRPLVYMAEELGIDYTPFANAIHPGHPEYGTGHSIKLLMVVQVLDDLYNENPECRRNNLIAAATGSMARSGSFIHYPESNLIGGMLTKLPEFQQAT